MARSANVETVFVAPGNAGTAFEHKCQNVPLPEKDFESLANFVETENVELTIVGPEVPLVDGIRDYFDSQGLLCFGPSAAAAQLEGSKSFAKEFMQRHGIPTAGFCVVNSVSKATEYLTNHEYPIVVKADGLAAGKGVVIAHDYDEVIEAVTGMIERETFGAAGKNVVLEDFLAGEEASFTVMIDGVRAIPFASSQDHKPIFEGDQGPNTGGMGTYSPAPVVDENTANRIMNSIIEPTVRGMREEGMPYQGFLYAGLMVAPNGEINVVEFNCRFGDPEAEAVLPRLDADLAAMCIQGLTTGYANTRLEFKDEVAVCVVMASGGYPGLYERNKIIHGLDNVDADALVFHAGTALEENRVVTNGGRVLCVVGLGQDVTSAQQHAYDNVSRIHWDNRYFRKDIGYRALERERKAKS